MMLVAQQQAPTLGKPCAPVRSPSRSGPPEIVLDLSRLLSRLLHPSPTGVDRVEFAYARALLRRIPDRLSFGAVHPTGRYGRLKLAQVELFLDALAERWEARGGFEKPWDARRFAAAWSWALRPRRIEPPRRPRVLLQASPHHLEHRGRVAAKLRRERARFVCLVHDLIPVTHPEFARPNGAERHHRRLVTIAAHADGVLTNSHATAAAFATWEGLEHPRPLRVAHLGCDPLRPAEGRTPYSDEPYFISLGTIEPRKNHLLLLNIWRSLVAALGPATPKLLLVGRRGWENENILDMLDRCAALRDMVIELPRLPDAGLRPLIRDARALLMPSFAEGFGLPIAEALAAGVPVLASDLPAHREAGGAVPEYFDPIDGEAWRSAVLAYAAPASPRRAAQLTRLAQWRPASWDSHIDSALALAEEVAAC